MVSLEQWWILHTICIAFALLNVQLTDAVLILRPTKINTLHLYNNEEYVNHTVQYSLTPPKMHLTVNMKKPIEYVDMTIDGIMRDNKNPQYYSKVEFRWNLCRALKFIEASQLGTFVFSYLKKFGDVIENCPIPAGTYNMKGFYLPEFEATKVLPEFTFEFLISFYGVDAKGTSILGIRDFVTGVVSHVDVPEADVRGIM